MSTVFGELTPALLYPTQSERMRLFALLYFVILLIVWNALGHTILGFEQSLAQLLAAVGSAVVAQIALDCLDAKMRSRVFRLKRSFSSLASLLAPALISGLAIGMLLFANRLCMPFVFASVAAISSKVIFRAPIGNNRTQHFFNPSNFGIVLALFASPWISIAPPYHFMGHSYGAWNWIVPAIILLSGIIVHALSTGRLILVSAWLVGFLSQAFLRHILLGSGLVSALVPMTSTAFIIFTLYMIPDPATTPVKAQSQIAFGLSVAFLYGLLQATHQVHGLFGALFIICLIRGIALHVLAILHPKSEATASSPT